MGQLAPLGFPGVLQQTSGRLGRQGQGLTAKRRKIPRPEMTGQGPYRTINVKLPGIAASQGGPAARFQDIRQVAVHQYLGWPDTFQFTQQSLFAGDLAQQEPPAGDIHPRQTITHAIGIAAILPAGQSQQDIVLLLIEQGLIGNRSGGDDPHHLPLHRSLAGFRVTNLFADGDGYPGLHQPGQVAVGSMIGNAAHGDRLTCGLSPGGEGDVENPGSYAGVLVEQLVEIPHAIEQQTILVLGLDAHELLHHWGMCGVGGQNGAQCQGCCYCQGGILAYVSWLMDI